MIDYKKQDIEAFLAYLKGKGAVRVNDIISNSGVNSLRVYPILFELQQSGVIEVLETVDMGAPKVIRLK